MDNCFEVNQRKKRTKSDMSWSRKDKVSYNNSRPQQGQEKTEERKGSQVTRKVSLRRAPPPRTVTVTAKAKHHACSAMIATVALALDWQVMT
eukprot:2957279-Ditylum_brightwellii.AAC.1